MARSIAKCGITLLCVLAASCSNLPSSRNQTGKMAAPELENEAAAPETTQEQEEASGPEQDQPGIAAPPGARRENLTCFSGSEDRQARIGVELIDGEVAYFAYYSKWRPRTCSLEAGRGDARSRWIDNGAYSTVKLADRKGELRIEHKGGKYRFAFLNVDRGRYCGMPGKINGSLTVTRGKANCAVEGVMDGHAM